MNGSVSVAVRVLDHAAGLPLPQYATALAAGCDLLAAVPAGEPLTLAPGARALVPCGIALALLSRFVKAVFSCLVAAFIITFNTWFFMQIHWDTEWVLAKGFFWHYLKDVFGACAAGGYVMSLPDGECVN